MVEASKNNVNKINLITCEETVWSENTISSIFKTEVCLSIIHDSFKSLWMRLVGGLNSFIFSKTKIGFQSSSLTLPKEFSILLN